MDKEKIYNLQETVRFLSDRLKRVTNEKQYLENKINQLQKELDLQEAVKKYLASGGSIEELIAKIGGTNEQSNSDRKND